MVNELSHLGTGTHVDMPCAEGLKKSAKGAGG